MRASWPCVQEMNTAQALEMGKEWEEEQEENLVSLPLLMTLGTAGSRLLGNKL